MPYKETGTTASTGFPVGKDKTNLRRRRSMTMTEDFDLGFGREECSLIPAFATLKAQIKRDVEARNKSLYGNHEFKFAVSDDGDVFTVYTEANRAIAGKIVTFERNRKKLTVKNGDGKEKFVAVLTLCPDRFCRFRIGKDEYDFWYVRKMPSEDLFFWSLR